jgi:hypothetical protein
MTIYADLDTPIIYRAVLQDEPGKPVPHVAEVRVGTAYDAPLVGAASEFRMSGGRLTALLTINPHLYAPHLEQVRDGVSLYADEFKVIGPEA